MKAIDLLHCQTGAVSSRADGSVKISFVTPELRPSEAGALILLHGKNCRLGIIPEDVPETEPIVVDTEFRQKTPGQRLRAVLFVAHQSHARAGETFPEYYTREVNRMIDEIKATLP